jgi:hypothetical protein
LIGAIDEKHRNVEAERARGLEIDRKVELCRLLDGDVGRSGAAQNLVCHFRALERS